MIEKTYSKEQIEFDYKVSEYAAGLKRYLMCIVHPDNVFSLDNARKQGHEFVKVGEKYGRYWRTVLLKRL